ncbi:MAG: hypothetical protein OXR68_06810 [Alphaproteobacteria bacterium]|nr:hypothetical protein [Alphaproteobacteria bacterium]MDD9920315.1 hypothetical protein [Alphaproteobacteria bacterium]
MKISKNDVITQNLSLIRGFVSDIRTGDDINVVADRVGDRVTVSPNNSPAKEITVVFKLEAAMAVSKGAELDEITSLINSVTHGGIMALGTGFTAGGLTAGQGIAGATVNTLTRIMNAQFSQDNVHFQVEIKEIGANGEQPKDVSVTATVEGWTVTTDWDSDEIANVSYQAELLNKSGATIKTENVGKSKQMPIASTNSTAKDTLKTDTALARLDLGWNLKTDGAFTHDTISLIQIDSITLVIREEES